MPDLDHKKITIHSIEHWDNQEIMLVDRTDPTGFVYYHITDVDGFETELLSKNIFEDDERDFINQNGFCEYRHEDYDLIHDLNMLVTVYPESFNKYAKIT